MRRLFLLLAFILEAAAPARAACALPPLFDGTGPDCTPERQTLSCTCSECFDWWAVPDATFYSVGRLDPGQPVRIVGTTESRNYPPDETTPAGLTVTRWCSPWDAPFPREGELYGYVVRACNANGCGPWSMNSVSYRAAPYACFAGGIEIPCYPGDPLSH